MIIGKLKIFWHLIRETYISWDKHEPFGKSATIAYYTLFSLPPLVMIVSYVAGQFYGVEAVRGKIVHKLGNLIGEGVSTAIEGMVASAAVDKTSIFSVIIGILMLIFGATGVFVQLKKTMNDLWEVKTKQTTFLKTLWERLISFGMIIVLGFLFLISLLLSIILNALSEYIVHFAPNFAVVLANIFSFLLSFIVSTILFGAAFKYLPDIHIRWKTTLLGAALTTILFLIGEYLLGYYFANSDPTSIYGGASSVVLILLWVFYTCLIFLFGAEFTFQYAKYLKEKVGPNKHAEGLTELAD